MAAFTLTVRTAVRGYHVYKDIWAPAIGDERGTILPKGRVLQGVGMKYCVSVFFFSFGGPSSLSLKTIVEGSSSQSGPGVSATNSTDLPFVITELHCRTKRKVNDVHSVEKAYT